jgi:hypothetical protein
MSMATTTTPEPSTTTPPAAPPPLAQPQPAATLAPATPQQRIQVVFDADNPASLYMDTGIFEQLQRVASLLSSSELVPAHFRGKKPDCFLVVAQAFRWRMDPFAVAAHTFVTSGKLGYEGKLIAGMINASNKLQSNLRPVYAGDKGQPGRSVRIVGRLKGEAEDREVEGTVQGWATQNPKWREIPDQMLFYRGAREWARRHMPEVMLGIQAEEEIEPDSGRGKVVDITPGRGGRLDALTESLAAEAPPVDVAAEPGAAEGAALLTDTPAPAEEAEPEVPEADPYCPTHGPLVVVVKIDKKTGKSTFTCGTKGCSWSAEK